MINRKSEIENRKLTKAFTLIELMVVIIILAVLAALIIPRLTGKQDDAKRAQAQTNITELEKSLELFRMDCDRYPTSEEGLIALVQQPADVTNWRGPYIKKLPPDPWGEEYMFDSDGRTFTIMSYGPDRAEGGEGNDADLYGGDVD